jgi:predicted Zn-dependent protease
MKIFFACCLFAISGIFAGCQTNPITGRSQLMIVSEQQAMSSSAQAYASTVSEANQKGILVTNPAITQRVQIITNRLIGQATNMRPESGAWQWSVNVIDDKQVNAWCMPGGKMAVYTGLLNKVQPTDDELAQVMAHEISHALLSHGREKMSRALATEAGLAVGSIATKTDLSKMADVANVAILLPNSREAENEADRLGIELAARSGYNPNAAVSMWQKMSRLSTSEPPQFLSTHPSNESRINNLSQLAPQMMPLYQNAKNTRR